MTERDPFEERLAHDLAAIADSRFTAVDPHATAEAAIAAEPPRRLRWGRPLASVAVIVVAIGVGFSAASLLPKPPGASSTPPSSSVSAWGNIAWERAPADPGVGHDPMLNQWMGGVVAGGPGFVAWGLDEKRLPDRIGNGFAVWVSGDALTWREVIFDPDAQINGAAIFEMAAGPVGIVASGAVCCDEPEPGFHESIPARWFSPDGEHWTRVAVGGLQPDPQFHAVTLVAGPGGFVEAGAANDQPAVWFSPDGTRWNGIPLGVDGFTSGIVNDVTTHANGYVAVGRVWNDEQGLAMVWRSTNGVDWVRAGVNDPVLSTGPINVLEEVVSYAGGLLVMGRQAIPAAQQTCWPFPMHPGGPMQTNCRKSEGVQLSSADGEHWTALPIRELKEGELGFFALSVGEGTGLMAVGPAHEPDTDFPVYSLWTSPDGVHWTRAVEDPPLAPGDYVHGFVVVGDRIIAIGQTNAENSAAVWIGTRLDETPASPRSVPPGGISEDLAIQLARPHATRDAELVSAVAGPFGEIYQDGRIGPDYPVDPGQLVWAVAFSSEMVICPPDGSACWPPRPGRTTVVLDFYTGEFLSAPVISPPSPTPRSTPAQTPTGLTEEQAVAIAREAAPQSADRDVTVAEVGLMDELEPGWSYDFFLPADRLVWRIVLSTTGPPLSQEGSVVFIDFLDGRVYGVVDFRA